MGRYKQAPGNFECPYRKGCPHMDGVSAMWARSVFRNADIQLQGHWRIREMMPGEIDDREPYDIIFLDAYGAEDIPYALATREFLQAVRKAVTPKGVVVTNLMIRSSNRLYDSMVRTYIDVFDEVHVVDIRNSGNAILLALRSGCGVHEDAKIAAGTHQRLSNNVSPQIAICGLAGCAVPV